MEYLLLVLWFACGLLAFSLMNPYMRHEFKSLHIENYWSSIETERVQGIDVFMLILMTFLGLGSLIGVFFIWSFGQWRYKGFSLRLTAWTEEEAKELFPNDYKYEFSWNRKYN